MVDLKVSKIFASKFILRIVRLLALIFALYDEVAPPSVRSFFRRSAVGSFHFNARAELKTDRGVGD